MKNTAVAFVLVAFILAGLGVCVHVCDQLSTSDPLCYQLFQRLEDALNEDKGNMYRLRKAFFYAPNAMPVLMKVIYNVTFAANINELDYCGETLVRDNKTLSLNETAVVFGWTSSGIFTVVHPLVINFMQIQLPFVLLRIFYLVLESDRGPEAQTFLWDGTYDLPELHINLTISTLPCIPSEYTFMSALNDFNSMIRVYAGMSDFLDDGPNTQSVGFSLPRSSVSGQGFRDSSYVPFYLVYMISSLVLYVLCVTTALFISSRSRNKMKSFTSTNTDVLVGLTIVMGVFIILEVVTEIIMASIWSDAVKDPVITVYVFLSTAIYCVPGVVSAFNIAKQIYKHTQEKKNKDGQVADKSHTQNKDGQVVDKSHAQEIRNKDCQVTDNSHAQEERNEDGQVADESNAQDKEGQVPDKSITSLYLYSFIWLSSYFAYLLLYAFFPAFILAFAYPIRVISIFVFMATFMVLFTVSVITYIKRKVKPFKHPECLVERFTPEKLNLTTKVIVGIFIMFIFLYFFLFVFGLLYSLIIGKASVVSSAPLALLSLLPSILISVTAWIIKKTVLDNTNKDPTPDNTNIKDPNPDNTNKDTTPAPQYNSGDKNSTGRTTLPQQQDSDITPAPETPTGVSS